MEMYIFRNGKEYGPFPLEKVKRFFADNKLKPDDKVWHEGLVDWVPATRFPGIRPSLQKVSSSPLGQEDAPRRKVELYRRKVSLVVFVVLGFGLLAATLFLIQSDQSGPETTSASPSYLEVGPPTNWPPTYLYLSPNSPDQSGPETPAVSPTSLDEGISTDWHPPPNWHPPPPRNLSPEKEIEESAPELENGLSSTEDSGRLTEHQKFIRAHNSRWIRQWKEQQRRWISDQRRGEAWVRGVFGTGQ